MDENSTATTPEETPAPVAHRRIRITRSGEESTARCTCGWSVTTDPSKVGSAAAAHARNR